MQHSAESICVIKYLREDESIFGTDNFQKTAGIENLVIPSLSKCNFPACVTLKKQHFSKENKKYGLSEDSI
jgi:hypothetical protein